LAASAPTPALEPMEVEPNTALALSPQATELAPVAVAPAPSSPASSLSQTNCAAAGRGVSSSPAAASAAIENATPDRTILLMTPPDADRARPDAAGGPAPAAQRVALRPCKTVV